MAVIYKCKLCGGTLSVNEDGKTAICDYCHSPQTLPKDKDEKLQNILNRANDFRMANEFDRAIFEYEKALELDEQEPETHWGLFLSKYGIEYVKDPYTYQYKPTIHRITSKSVFDDVDYLAAIKYADVISQSQYESDAHSIDVVMKEFLRLSATEEKHDVFICYKEADDVTRLRTEDSSIAQDIYTQLTKRGYNVFYSRVSLHEVAGRDYEPYIYAALISAKAMIVVGSNQNYLNAVWVKNEWSRYVELVENGENKIIIPALKGISADELPSQLSKYQALSVDSIDFLSSLETILGKCITNSNSRIEYNKDKNAEDVFIERGFLALEDSEYQKADAFFENALNLNPHNSQAYFGKLMVEMRISHKEYILSSPRFLKEYSNFEKAVRFADPQLRTTLLQYEEKVTATLYEQAYNKALSQMSKASTVADYNAAIAEFQKIDFYKESKNKIEECKAIIKDLEYNDVVNCFNSASDIYSFKKVMNSFENFGEYKETKKYSAECRDRIYNLAIDSFDKSKNQNDFEKVKTDFESLGNYKNSKQYIIQCEQNISICKTKAERKERRRKRSINRDERRFFGEHGDGWWLYSNVIVSIVSFIISFIIYCVWDNTSFLVGIACSIGFALANYIIGIIVVFSNYDKQDLYDKISYVIVVILSVLVPIKVGIW